MPAIEFRVASPAERKAIMRTIDDLLGADVSSNVFRQMEIVISLGKRTELFLVPATVMNVFRNTQSKRNPYCLGIYLGDLLADELLPSIEGITLASPYTKKKVKVTDKGEQAVLYGRDLTASFIDDFSASIRQGDKIAIVNRLEETLALGKALLDGNRFRHVNRSTLVVKNILDRGWYLRKGA
jgi:ribosome biogenesis protein Nip4